MIDTVKYDMRLSNELDNFFPIFQGISIKALYLRIANIMKISIFYSTFNFPLSNVFEWVHKLTVHIMVIHNIVVDNDDFFDPKSQKGHHDDRTKSSEPQDEGSLLF